MGNYARLRNLYLKDEVVESLGLWPDYSEQHFTPHYIVPENKMITGKNGCPYFIAAPNEKDPQNVQYVEGTANHWKYKGKKLTQYWFCKDKDETLQGVVNGRFTYWASNHAIPGGISYENFEMKKRFHSGDRFVFGVTPLSAKEFIESIAKSYEF